jgi:hypothetical protein
MTRNRMCGQYPPAKDRYAYCPVCTRLCRLPQNFYDDDDLWLATTERIFTQADRVSRLHQAYRNRHH